MFPSSRDVASSRDHNIETKSILVQSRHSDLTGGERDLTRRGLLCLQLLLRDKEDDDDDDEENDEEEDEEDNE